MILSSPAGLSQILQKTEAKGTGLSCPDSITIRVAKSTSNQPRTERLSDRESGKQNMGQEQAKCNRGEGIESLHSISKSFGWLYFQYTLLNKAYNIDVGILLF